MLGEMHDPFMAKGKVPAKIVETCRETHTHFIKKLLTIINTNFTTLSRSKNNKVFRKGLKIRIKKNVGMALILQRNALCSIYFSQIR